jgi:cytochrome b subunit of formate dehydrogenase
MKQHKFDALSFVSGLVLTLGGLLFLIPTDMSNVFDTLWNLGTWFWPVIFLTVGLAILVPALTRVGRRSDDQA